MSHSPESRKGGHKNSDDPKVIQLGVNISLGGNSTSDVEVFVNDRKQPCGQLTAPTLSPSKHASIENTSKKSETPGEDSGGGNIEDESPCQKPTRRMDKIAVSGGGSERDESWKGSRCEELTIVDEIESAIDNFEKFSEHVKDIPRLSTRRLGATSTPYSERANSRSEGNLSSFSCGPRSYVPKHDFRDGKYFRKPKPLPGDLFLKPLPGDDYFRKGFVRRYRQESDPYRYYTSADDLPRFYEYSGVECGSVVPKSTHAESEEYDQEGGKVRKRQKGEGSEGADRQSTSSESAKDIKIYQSGGIIIMQNFSETADLIDNSGESSKKLVESCNRVRERIESMLQQSSDESQKVPQTANSSPDEARGQSTGKFVQFDLSSCQSKSADSASSGTQSRTVKGESAPLRYIPSQFASSNDVFCQSETGNSHNQDFPSLSTQENDSVPSNPPGVSPTSSACGKKLEWDSGADVGYSNAGLGKNNMSTIERIILRGLSGEDTSSKTETSQLRTSQDETSQSREEGGRSKGKGSEGSGVDSTKVRNGAEQVSNARRNKSKHHTPSKKAPDSLPARKASRELAVKPSYADKSTFVDTLFNEFCLELPLDDVIGSEEESGLSESSDRSPVIVDSAKRLTKRRKGSTRRNSGQQTNVKVEEKVDVRRVRKSAKEGRSEKAAKCYADQMIQTTELEVESKSVQVLESSSAVSEREATEGVQAAASRSRSVQAADSTSSLPKHLGHAHTSVEQPNTKATQFFGGPATSLPNFRRGVKDPRAKVLNDRLNEEENRRNSRTRQPTVEDEKASKGRSRRKGNDPENKENVSTEAEGEELAGSKRSSLLSKRSESVAFGSCDVQPSENGGGSSYLTSEILKERGDNIDRNIIQEKYFESQLQELREVETRGTSPERRIATERDTQTSFSRCSAVSVSCQYSPQSGKNSDDQQALPSRRKNNGGYDEKGSAESSVADKDYSIVESLSSSSQTAHSWVPGIRFHSKSRRFATGRALSFEYLPGHMYEKGGKLEWKRKSATMDGSPSRVREATSLSPESEGGMKESESGNTIVLENSTGRSPDEEDAEIVFFDSGQIKTLDSNLAELEIVVSRLHEKEAIFQRITNSVLSTMLTGKESGDSSRVTGTDSAVGSKSNTMVVEEVSDEDSRSRKVKQGEEISIACQTETLASNSTKFYEERRRLEERMNEEKEQQIKWIENEINHLNMLRSLLEKQESSISGSTQRRKRHHYLTEAKEESLKEDLLKTIMAESFPGEGSNKEPLKVSESTTPSGELAESSAIRTVKELSGKSSAQFGMALSLRKNNTREVTMLPVGVQLTLRDVKIKKNLSDMSSSTDSRCDVAGFQVENQDSRCTCVKCNEGKCICLQPGEGGTRRKGCRGSERWRSGEGRAGSSIADGDFSRSAGQIPSGASISKTRMGSAEMGSRIDDRLGSRGFPESAGSGGGAGSTLERCPCGCHAQPLPRCDDCNLLNTCKSCRCYRRINSCSCNRGSIPRKFGSSTSPRRNSGNGIAAGNVCQLCRCSSVENQVCALCPCHLKQSFSLCLRGPCRCKKKYKERSCQTENCRCHECNDSKREDELYRETKYMTENTREMVEREPSVVITPSESRHEAEKKQSVEEKFSYEMKVPVEKRCACPTRPLHVKNLTAKQKCRCTSSTKSSKSQKKVPGEHPRHYFLQVEETTEEDESSESCDNGNDMEVITIRVPIRKYGKGGGSSPQKKGHPSQRSKRQEKEADGCNCCEDCKGHLSKRFPSRDRAVQESDDCNCCEGCKGYPGQGYPPAERPEDMGHFIYCEDCNGYRGGQYPVPEKAMECNCCPDCKGHATRNVQQEDWQQEEGECDCCEDCAGRGREDFGQPLEGISEDVEIQAQRSRSAGSAREGRPAFADSSRPSSGSRRASPGSRVPSPGGRRPSPGSRVPSAESTRQSVGSRAPSSESARPPLLGSRAQSSDSTRPAVGSRGGPSSDTRPLLGTWTPSDSPRPIGSRVPSAEAAKAALESRTSCADFSRWPTSSKAVVNKEPVQFPTGDDAGGCNCCEDCVGHAGPVSGADRQKTGWNRGKSWQEPKPQPPPVSNNNNCNCCDDCEGRKYAAEERYRNTENECRCCADCPGRSDTGDSSAGATQEENASTSEGEARKQVTEAGENLPPIKEENSTAGERMRDKSKEGAAAADAKNKRRPSRSKGERPKKEAKMQRKCPPGCKPCPAHPPGGKGAKPPKAMQVQDRTKEKCRGADYFNFNKKEYMTKSELEREEKKKRPTRLTLQECLTVKRPDLYTRAECRRKIISEKTKERVDKHAKRMECLAKLLPQCDVPGNAPELKLFTSAEMKKQTKKYYKNLPEVANKLAEEKKIAEFRTNKLLAEIFAKKLQMRTLKGCVNLSNSFTVMSAN